MKAFIYNGEEYIRCIPGKRLFSSTMVHEVVNRGDIFALRVSDQTLTVLKGTTGVEHYEMVIYERGMEPIRIQNPEAALARLAAVRIELKARSKS